MVIFWVSGKNTSVWQTKIEEELYCLRAILVSHWWIKDSKGAKTRIQTKRQVYFWIEEKKIKNKEGVNKISTILDRISWSHDEICVSHCSLLLIKSLSH